MRKMATLGAGWCVVLAACGGNPQPGEPGYAYNLGGDYGIEFAADDGSVFSGTVSLETGPGGIVSGTMTLTDPMTIHGTAEGLIVGADLTLNVSFTIPDTGCTGLASGGGTIAEGGDSAGGTVEIQDDCGGAPPSATFALSRSP